MARQNPHRQSTRIVTMVVVRMNGERNDPSLGFRLRDTQAPVARGRREPPLYYYSAGE